MNRWSSYLLSIVVCLIAAGAATSFALAQTGTKHTNQVQSTQMPTPAALPTPSSTPSATPTPIPVATSTPLPQRTAITNGFVHMRAAKSTSSAIVVDLQGGTAVVLGNDETSLWQQVNYGSYAGYLWKSYLNY